MATATAIEIKRAADAAKQVETLQTIEQRLMRIEECQARILALLEPAPTPSGKPDAAWRERQNQKGRSA